MPVYYLFREVFEERTSLERLIFKISLKKPKKFHISISQYLIVICVLFTRLIQQKFLVHITNFYLATRVRKKNIQITYLDFSYYNLYTIALRRAILVSLSSMKLFLPINCHGKKPAEQYESKVICPKYSKQ